MFEDGRRLGGVERLYRLLDDAGGARFAVVARLRGDVDPERLRGALVGLRERHPLLGCRVDRRGGELWFRRSGVPATSLTVADGVERWESGAQAELDTPLDVGRGPLLRARLARRGPEGSALTLVFDHCAADGRSAIRAALDLLDVVISHGDSSTNPVGSFGDLDHSLEHHLPARARGLRGLLRLVGLQTWRTLGQLVRGVPRRLPRETRAAWAEHRVGLCSLDLEPEDAGRLLRATRRRGTTVHGALCAAQLRAIAAESGRRRRLMLNHPVDLRGRTSPPVAGGVHLTGLDTLHRVGPATDPWVLAQAVRRDLLRAIESGQGGYTLPMVAAVFRRLGWLFGPTPAGARRAARAVRLGAPYTTTVSNLGDLGPPRRGPIEDIRFAFCPPAPFLFASTASTFAGRLGWTFCWREPAVSQERGHRLAERSLALLLDSLDKG